MDDLQARLDRAITKAEHRLRHMFTSSHVVGFPSDALDHYAALVALRARREEISQMPCPAGHDAVCGRQDELTAEAERLLGEDA